MMLVSLRSIDARGWSSRSSEATPLSSRRSEATVGIYYPVIIAGHMVDPDTRSLRSLLRDDISGSVLRDDKEPDRHVPMMHPSPVRPSLFP